MLLIEALASSRKAVLAAILGAMKRARPKDFYALLGSKTTGGKRE